MNYELAKKLKDAGFPNIKIDEYFEHRIGSHSDDYGGSSDVPCYCNKDRFPTLSELIEACGDKFGHLYKSGIGWIADDQKGESPEEAVANLWLELNKK